MTELASPTDGSATMSSKMDAASAISPVAFAGESNCNLAEAIGGSNMAHLGIAGTSGTLDVLNTQGGGQAHISFDTRDVFGIALWDNDALDGHVIQIYTWNGTNYGYSYSI